MSPRNGCVTCGRGVKVTSRIAKNANLRGNFGIILVIFLGRCRSVLRMRWVNKSDLQRYSFYERPLMAILLQDKSYVIKAKIVFNLLPTRIFRRAKEKLCLYQEEIFLTVNPSLFFPVMWSWNRFPIMSSA